MKIIQKVLHTSLISSVLFFTACSVKEEAVITPKKETKEFSTFANTYANTVSTNQRKDKYFKKYFIPWNQRKVSYPKDEAKWGFKYQYKTMYLENHVKAEDKWFKKQIENSNFDNYNTLLKKAITLKNTNIRVFPTNSPMFYNPKKAGEGFPFDYNQNSAIKINTPIFISHYSKDKAWVYVQSFSVGGWISIDDVAFVNKAFIKEFKTNDYSVAVKEKFPLYDTAFRAYVKVATIFPKKNGKYIIARKDFSNNAIITYVNINAKEVQSMPLAYNRTNRLKIAQALLNEPYSWGGLLNNRDCSSFTKDYFAPFGKFLERNSKGQTKNGKYLDVSKMSKQKKKDYIKENAIPFSTLVYLKGHIMLYIGMKGNEPMVMHNMWSVRLKDKRGNKYRHIVGKTSITTLEPGKDLKDFDENNNILRQVRGIVIL